MRPARISSIATTDGVDAFDILTNRLRAFREERAWEQYHTPKNLAISIAIEASELLEHFQWLSDDDVLRHMRDNEREVASEIADVAIYVLQLADVLGVSLAVAIEEKLRANAEHYPIAASHGNSQKYTKLRRTQSEQ